MDVLIYLFIAMFSVIMIFICREIACWYFKFNEMLAVQKEILNCLKNQNPDKTLAMSNSLENQSENTFSTEENSHSPTNRVFVISIICFVITISLFIFLVTI